MPVTVVILVKETNNIETAVQTIGKLVNAGSTQITYPVVSLARNELNTRPKYTYDPRKRGL